MSRRTAVSGVIIFCAVFQIIFAAFAMGAPAGKGIRSLGYAIQMGAFSDVNNAERFTTTLQKKGIEAFYFRKDSGIYAVRFGDFPTKDKARKAAERLVSDKLIESYYIAPPKEIVFSKLETPRQTPGRERIVDAAGQTTEKPENPQQKQPRNDKDMGSIAARTAERFVGIPYRWGGDNVVDGMDCSGFVRAVYNLCGLSIPRTSRDQYRAGEPVSKNSIRDGDLVFFGSSENSINHVGIYTGNGRFVHAPKRGEDIKTSAVSESYFERRFVGARRYFQ